jgi:hypothetical protein
VPRRTVPVTVVARGLYESLYEPGEKALLLDAVDAGDLRREIELLRVLVRRSVAAGLDLELVSRALARLSQILRVQHLLSGDAARSLDEALGKVLEEIGSELRV